jgi:hypothetical protein
MRAVAAQFPGLAAILSRLGTEKGNPAAAIACPELRLGLI